MKEEEEGEVEERTDEEDDGFRLIRIERQRTTHHNYSRSTQTTHKMVLCLVSCVLCCAVGVCVFNLELILDDEQE